MKKMNLNKLISFVLVCVMLMGTFVINVYAEDTDAAPAAEIVSENVYYQDTLKLMFAVKAEDGVDYTLTVTDSEGSDVPVEEYLVDGVQVEAKGGLVYITKIGVPAQNIADEVLVEVSVDGQVVDSKTYSVLEYLYTRLYVNDDATAEQKKFYNGLLTYADIADQFLNAEATSVSDYKFVHFTNATYDGEESIITLPGDLDLSKVSGIEVPEGHKVVWTVEEYNANGLVGTTENVEVITVEDNHLVLTASTVDASVAIETELAVFELGANGTATHTDGSEKSTYTESNGGYTLSITGGSKMYTGARDQTGNSCLKFGTSSAIGSMSFTVPENVTKVVIAVAKYKANATTVSINGASTTLTKNSNDGAYDLIEIDTTEVKTISFATTSSGKRAMLNTITFIGFAE